VFLQVLDLECLARLERRHGGTSDRYARHQINLPEGERDAVGSEQNLPAKGAAEPVENDRKSGTCDEKRKIGFFQCRPDRRPLVFEQNLRHADDRHRDGENKQNRFFISQQKILQFLNPVLRRRESGRPRADACLIRNSPAPEFSADKATPRRCAGRKRRE
jgi:hypothetical protein